MAIPPFPLQELHRFGHCFLTPVRLLIVLRQSISNKFMLHTRYLSPFHNFYLCMASLGAQYGPVSLDVPVTQHGIS
ncbi:hypothetical protein D3Z47_03950 [Lachnospiraceae bacterium]|nr:hypothetical protein [Lachnospiraceae bacterium]